MKRYFSAIVLIIAFFCLPACAASGGGADADLAGFYENLSGKYLLPEMTEADEAAIESYYPGLSDIALIQKVVKIPKITSSVCEFVFVQCENAEDVAAAEEILQARIDEQASGGAWYPATMAAWEKAEVVTNGNYVAMISDGDDTASIASDWNALFEQR
ncbi:MAG: DUF4358 domain-containing protein [Clostridia bacterium]|nr:DUF4358 domain-containing protein [Clostridia bacterium]